MSLIAINVCLVCNIFDTAAIPLSNSLCPPSDDGVWSSSTAYRLVSLAEKKPQRGSGYPHCTVAQICVRATELSTVKEHVKAVWQRHRKLAEEKKEQLLLTGIDAGPVFATLEDGTEVHLPNITMECSEALRELHNDVVETLKPLHVQLGSMEKAKSTFNKGFPAGEGSITWMIEYLAASAGEHYRPHITLGASPIPAIDRLTVFQAKSVPLQKCRLVVSQMGNYCSCFELLE